MEGAVESIVSCYEGVQGRQPHPQKIPLETRLQGRSLSKILDFDVLLFSKMIILPCFFDFLTMLLDSI